MARFTVEVLGISAENKGAGLMLAAICRRLRQEFPEVKIAIPIQYPFDKRLALGLWGTIPRDKTAVDLGRVVGLIPPKARRLTGILHPREVDVVLDASGFGYGDYWGARSIERRLLNPLLSWKSDRNLFVLLPQAFGPFERPGMRRAMSRALEKIDLVFARDRESLKYLQECSAASVQKIQIAPDFTNLLKAELPPDLLGYGQKAVLVPNYRMIMNAEPRLAEAYVEFLCYCQSSLLDAGNDVMFVIHEGGEDREIAERVNMRSKRKSKIFHDNCPLRIKAVIANAKMVISSRFHAIVSGLSSGVPVLATGWSHKYRELMEDYGCADNLVDLRSSDGWKPLIRRFIDSVGLPEMRVALRQRAEAQVDASEAMWSHVFAAIRQKGIIKESS